MNLLTNEIWNFVDTRDWPTGLVYRMSEKEYFLQFTLYRDNFNKFSGEDQLQIANMVKEIMESIRGRGVPIYLEVAKGDGLVQSRDSMAD